MKNDPNLSQFRANYMPMSPFGTNSYKNYLLDGRMEEYNKWITRSADSLLYRQEWIQCSSKNTRDNHFKEHSVC